MKSVAKRRKLTMVSNEEFRKSRGGLLGRFPSEDLYEAEILEENHYHATKSKEFEKSDKRSANTQK